MRKQFGRSLLALCLVATAMAVPTHENERALQAVTQGATQFSNDFFKAVSAQQPGNIISSPLSAYMVLTMASSGAGGNTLEQFRNVLHLPTDDALTRSGSQSIIDSMNNVKDVNLRLANKIYAAAKFPVKQSFQDVVANFFRSASQSVDFTDSVTAANTINRWCEEQTNNRIKDLINPGDLDSMTAMVLVNAVYFKGNWKHKFNPDHTTDRPFHISESVQKNVPTMYIKDDFKYGDISEINAKFVEIPYKGDGMSMIIILPDNINGLAEVVEKLPQINLANLVQTAYKREVKLFLPKFKIETKIELNNILQKLGLTDMYSNRANFSGISDVPLAVSKAVQKAYIEVNEEGSEAAAATGLIGTITSLIPENRFVADHPFIFYIVVKDEGGADRRVMPIFVGHVDDPSMQMMMYSMTFEQDMIVDRPFVYAIIRSIKGDKGQINDVIPLFIGVTIQYCCLVYSEIVLVDRPFTYAIVKTSGDGQKVPLFVGTVVDPTV